MVFRLVGAGVSGPFLEMVLDGGQTAKLVQLWTTLHIISECVNSTEGIDTSASEEQGLINPSMVYVGIMVHLLFRLMSSIYQGVCV
jgi:hypothetical protein